ncbi:transposase [Streptomyces sp. NPDC006984]|uniref:IS701 family transposase n=1 Tax=unclassified Streptomyces TaxID=2593676 RepID=UPI0033E0F1DC
MSPSETCAAAEDEVACRQAFLEDVFGPLHRAEQRRWARAYLLGLIQASGRKTPRRIARSNPLPPAAAHGLHQFINASPWDWEPVRRRLALWVAGRTPPHAWTVTELVIPKRGEHSVGVHRCLDAQSGRTVNCQRAVGLFLVTQAHCYPVDWRLLLDESWIQDPERRLRARIPEAETARPLRAHVLDYAADIAARPRLPPVPWVLDLTPCTSAGRVLAGFAGLRLDVVCEVEPGQIVLAGHRPQAVTTVGRLMETRYARDAHVTAGQAPACRARTAPIRAYAGTVALPRPGGFRGGGANRYRILEVRDPTGRHPARYWASSLTDRSVDETVALVRSRVAVRSAVATLREQFGVLDFAGRSFPGWHHHMTMASAAYAYQHLHAAAGPVTQVPAPLPAHPARAAS